MSKIVGVGLNKTGTKTLGRYLESIGLRHKTYSRSAFTLYRRGDLQSVRNMMEQFDSFEDWPWPLLYREIDQWFPDARFVLTVRKTPHIWYRSLCNMAVRRGPLDRYEKYIYGHAMPQGHRDELIRYYLDHNQAVEDHFAGRPGKLLRVCWEEGRGGKALENFLKVEFPLPTVVHANRSSSRVYSGDSRLFAHLNRIAYQMFRRVKRLYRRCKKRVCS